ncbi:hypothetical protein SAY87_029417 [Trapa incisa]|uniref:Phytocyanin domain-containing protein n=1 Tax=Trapa incisa TaxID=236973 RepID=A0AAN7K4F2_9MYRT|nr:hypothetical protein SAY87_029417 [Trapa incisa]
MASMISSNGRLLVLGCALAMVVGSVSATTHVVGDSYGWEVPLEAKFFQEWANSRTFVVGDKLVFPYSAGSNNVVVVDKVEFDHCTQNNPSQIFYNGTTTYNLTAAGDYYFITSFGKHCEYGQKLHVPVVDDQGEKPTRRLLASASSPSDAPDPGPTSSSAAPVGAAAVVVSGIIASMWM